MNTFMVITNPTVNVKLQIYKQVGTEKKLDYPPGPNRRRLVDDCSFLRVAGCEEYSTAGSDWNVPTAIQEGLSSLEELELRFEPK